MVDELLKFAYNFLNQINGGIILLTYFIFMVKLQAYKLNTIFAKKATRVLFKS